MKKLRRIASHATILENGSRQTLLAIELMEGRVINWFPLIGEMAQTEWMPGEIVLRRDEEGFLRAYHNNIMIE